MNIKNKIEWTKKHMPVMEKIRQEFLISKPFKGLGIACCLHLTKETAILLMALQDGGAIVVACASNPLSTQDDVVEYLKEERGMTVFGKKGMSIDEYEIGIREVGLSSCHYIIDDGADLTHFIHTNDNVAMKIPLGGLEETTTGVTRIKNMDLKYPIIAVNDAKMKHYFDNFYGTGQSTIDGIIRATNILLAGKNFVIAGYGYCGRGLAQRAKGMGCNVIITEIDPIKAIQATMDGFRVMKMEDAVFIADVIVTVTGSKDIITAQHVFSMKDGVIIANAGHFDIEIAMEEINKQFKSNIISDNITEYELPLSYAEAAISLEPRRKIIILSEGRLVNLAAAEGHPSEVMDTSFAAQALGLEYLIKSKLEAGVHEIPDEIDIQIAKIKLSSMGIDIDKETEEQINYRKS